MCPPYLLVSYPELFQLLEVRGVASAWRHVLQSFSDAETSIGNQAALCLGLEHCRRRGCVLCMQRSTCSVQLPPLQPVMATAQSPPHAHIEYYMSTHDDPVTVSAPQAGPLAKGTSIILVEYPKRLAHQIPDTLCGLPKVPEQGTRRV